MKTTTLNNFYTTDDINIGNYWESSELVPVGTIRVIDETLWYAKHSSKRGCEFVGFFGRAVDSYRTVWCKLPEKFKL